jgi:membrane protease YdiL (CAAX protease family)
MSNQNAAAFFAWLLLAVAVAAVAIGQQVRPRAKTTPEGDQPTKESVSQEHAALDLQNRLVIGAVGTVGRGGGDPSAWLKERQTGSAPQRVFFLVLAGELSGPPEVRRLYDEFAPALEQEKDKTWVRLARVVERLYEDYGRQDFEHSWLSNASREELTTHLGWSGKLALAPEGGPQPEEREQLLEGARRAFVIVASVFLLVGVLFVVGLIGWFSLPVLLAYGKSRFGLPKDVPHHGVYVETFTLWVLVYALISLLVQLIAPPKEMQLLLSGLGMLLSLSVLAWPVIRGIPWRRVRNDIGLTWGRRPFLEPFIGILVYSMALYLVLFGAAIALGIYFLQHPPSPGGEGGSPQDLRPNPIVEYMTNMDFWTWLQVFFAASVVAPFAEEVLFRGVLYRHLRGINRWLDTPLAVILSALLVSFIFAIIHPQTLYAVPVLMALAFGFALAREWRGTLIPVMVAHGLHNGLIVLVGSQLLSN